MCRNDGGGAVAPPLYPSRITHNSRRTPRNKSRQITLARRTLSTSQLTAIIKTHLIIRTSGRRHSRPSAYRSHPHGEETNPRTDIIVWIDEMVFRKNHGGDKKGRSSHGLLGFCSAASARRRGAISDLAERRARRRRVHVITVSVAGCCAHVLPAY